MLLNSEPAPKPSHKSAATRHHTAHHSKSRSLNSSQVSNQSIKFFTLPKNIMRSNTLVNETQLEPIDHVKSLNHLTLEQLQNSRRTIPTMSPVKLNFQDPNPKYPQKTSKPTTGNSTKAKSPKSSTQREVVKPAPLQLSQPSRVEINFHTDLSPLEAIKVKAEAQMKKGTVCKPKEVVLASPQKPNIHEPLQQRFQDVDLRWIEELEVINQDLLQFENTLGYDKQELENKFIEQINEDKERAKHKSLRQKARYSQTLNSKVMLNSVGIPSPSQNPQFNEMLHSNSMRLRASSSDDAQFISTNGTKDHRLTISQPRSHSPPANANGGIYTLFSPKDAKSNNQSIESANPSSTQSANFSSQSTTHSQQFPNHLLMRLETLEKELKKEKKLRKFLQSQLNEEQEKNKKLISKLNHSKKFAIEY